MYTDESCLRMDLSGDMEADQKLLDEIMKVVVKYMNSQKLKFNFGKSEFVIASLKGHADYKDLVLNFSGNFIIFQCQTWSSIEKFNSELHLTRNVNE